MVSGNEWANFFSEFSQAQGRFIEALTLAVPDLSSAQFRVCIYLKAGLNTREIAEEMNLSVRSIESHRYRLRKKMNIARSESLSMYLHRIK